MSQREVISGSAGTTSDDYARLYYASYAGARATTTGTPRHGGTSSCRPPYAGQGHDQPRTTLDVGLRQGSLVQALAARASTLRVSTSPSTPSNRPRGRARPSPGRSATGPSRRATTWSPASRCSSTWRRRTRSSRSTTSARSPTRCCSPRVPADFDEPTHINMRPTADWAAWFAERGFFRRTDVNLDFLTTWAVLFERRRRARRATSSTATRRSTPRCTPRSIEKRSRPARVPPRDRPPAQRRRQAR